MALNEDLNQLLEPAVASLGYELVLLELVRGKILTVRLYVDKPGGVTLEDCEVVSHQISALMDVEEPIRSNYNLEVSSPGLERPLAKPAHFQAQLGQVIRVMLTGPAAIEGRRKFKGELEAADSQSITVNVDGEPVELPLAGIERANLVPDYDALAAERAAQRSTDDSPGHK